MPLGRRQREGRAEPHKLVTEGRPLVRRRVCQRRPRRGRLNLVEPGREEVRGEHSAGRNGQARFDHPDKLIPLAADLRDARLLGTGKRDEIGHLLFSIRRNIKVVVAAITGRSMNGLLMALNYTPQGHSILSPAVIARPASAARPRLDD